jgi:uncharacterized membrane protein YjgN (DUF898 family)
VFDGDAGSYLGTSILAAILTVFTMGIGLPWAMCMREQWKANHSMIDGRRLKFVGTGGALFGTWIGMLALCVITFGIYSFWVGPKLMKWTWENTQIE